MTVSSGSAGDDSPWRRPATDAGPPARPDAGPPAKPDADVPPPSADAPADLPYQGPPRSNPPPAGWRPPIVAQPPSPRPLPEQDHARLDVAEQAARTLTYGVGLVVGAVLLVLLLLVCARGLF